MAIERTYTIPLRKEWLKAPRYRRAKKAVTAIKLFLKRHMKSEDIKIGKYLNELIWKQGIKNPPAKVRINVLKDDKNTVTAEIIGKPMPIKKEEKKKGITEKLKEKVIGKKEEKAEEKTKEMPKQEKKPEVKKEEVKEEKKVEVKKAEVKKEEVKKKAPKEKKVEKKAEPKLTQQTKTETKKETPKQEKPKQVKKPVSKQE